MAGFHAFEWQTVLLAWCVATIARAQTSTCARSYSESDGEVRLCTTLGSTFVGSEVAISSADTSATAGEDYLLLDREVEAQVDTNRGGMSVCTQLQIINDGQPEPSEYFSVEFRAVSSGILVASCTVEITDVSGSPFLKCQERQFMVQEGSVAQVCFVLRNAERLSRQLTVTANVFPQNAGTANANIDYNVFSTTVEFHPGVAEIACVNVSVLQDEALERVEYFYVAAVPNGMVGIPVGGDSCEVAIIDSNGPHVECPNQPNSTTINYYVQPGDERQFLGNPYGDDFCFDPANDVYIPEELCSDGVFVSDCTQWNSDSFHETLQSQSFSNYVQLLAEAKTNSTCLEQITSQVMQLYDSRETRAADVCDHCITNCVMSVVRNDCRGVVYLLKGVYLQSVAIVSANFPLDSDNCYMNLACCETQVPMDCTVGVLDHDPSNVKTVSLSVASATRPAVTPPPSNSSSEDSGDLSITASESVGVTVGATLGGALIVILVISGLVVLLCYCSTKRRSSYKSQTVDGEQEQYEEVTLHVAKSDQCGKWKQVFAGKTIDSSHLDLGDSLGEGTFGKVYKGKLQFDLMLSRQVAVRTLKKASSHKEIEDFIAKSALILNFDHPNVLGLLGICFAQDIVPLVVLPYMENGDLQSFLRSTDKPSTSEAFPEGISEPLLVRMCLDAAMGMQYLAAHNFIHRNLAAKNCMVDFQFRVRVADFGLPWDVCNTDYYCYTQNVQLPVQWMSPESLFYNIFNEKTDVWSFGVVCWEIFSLGGKPFSGVENIDIPNYVSNGHRLKKPTLCPDDLYKSIHFTWQYHPGDRPTFDQLVKVLASHYQQHMNTEHEYFVLEEPVTAEPDYANAKAYHSGDAIDNVEHVYMDLDFESTQNKPKYMNASVIVQTSPTEPYDDVEKMEPLDYEVPVPNTVLNSPHQLAEQEYKMSTSTKIHPKSTTPNDVLSYTDERLYYNVVESQEIV